GLPALPRDLRGPGSRPLRLPPADPPGLAGLEPRDARALAAARSHRPLRVTGADRPFLHLLRGRDPEPGSLHGRPGDAGAQPEHLHPGWFDLGDHRTAARRVLDRSLRPCAKLSPSGMPG